MKQNTLGRRLFKVLFYLAFLAFVLLHIGIVISLLSHLASREWMEALSYLFVYPAIWLGNGGIVIMATIWSYPLAMAASYLISGQMITRPWDV
ncbi:MAG: hypothetical protein VX095_02370 [Pseudomonadota bacterium]|nr:hypothetical protein [Pseudomonadota bacterium]